jgi:hypothetical protein
MIIFAVWFIMAMKKHILFAILIILPFLFCRAQVNPNTLNDSINERANRMHDSINANMRRLNDVINAHAKRVNDSINAHVGSVQHVPDSHAVIVSKNNPEHPAEEVFDSLHGKLIVVVRNIKLVAGNLNVALFNSLKSFMEDGPITGGRLCRLPVQ